MAWFETGWGGTGANANMGGGAVFGANVRIVGNVYRYNNIIQFRGAKGQVQITGSGTFWGMNLRQWVEIPRGVLRINDHHYGTGSKSGGQVLETWSGDWDVNSSSGATSMELNSGAAYGGDGVSWAGGLWVSFPAAGAPAGTTSYYARTDTSISVRNDVTNWGAHCTAGSVRSYRADNSSWTGQTYIGTTDNAVVDHTGLTPNTRYWFRGWSSNGAGLTSYHSSTDAATLANATETSKSVQATSTDFVLAVAQGYRSTTAKVQYRKVGDASWVDSSTGSGGTPTISVNGLLPSTEYEYRLAVTTTDGTWTGSTQTLTTLPAAKLVMPDGTVKNAIPHIIQPGGAEAMVKVKIL